MENWRETKWREAEKFLTELCGEIVTAKFEILLPENMPDKESVNPLYIPFALVLHSKHDIRQLTERHGKRLKTITLKMNEWAKKNIEATAKVDIQLPLANEIKREYIG